ncbi:hypothetical protein Z947_859 [Sulfitobacter geojensis]|nr:hypothetical protein Z947_859 [Sulfitobacter geojensis]
MARRLLSISFMRPLGAAPFSPQKKGVIRFSPEKAALV